MDCYSESFQRWPAVILRNYSLILQSGKCNISLTYTTSDILQYIINFFFFFAIPASMPNFMARLMYFKRKNCGKKHTLVMKINKSHTTYIKHYIRSFISIFDKIWVSLWNLWPKDKFLPLCHCWPQISERHSWCGILIVCGAC